jgi:iron complex outermembrane recepter protein
MQNPNLAPRADLVERRTMPLRVACVAALALAGTAPRARAQNALEPQAPAVELEEVVVTAQKRAENLQDVPISVQVLDEKELTQAGIRDFHDIALRTPGLDVQGAIPGGSVLTIRGVAPIGGIPTTGLYVDDVPITGVIGTYGASPEPRINDTASVEVLKGPQGTLYGDSAMGGALKFTNNRPDATAFSAHADVEGATTHDAAASYGTSGTLNVPLIDDAFAVRTSISYHRDGGYLDNFSPITRELTGEDVNSYDTLAARVALKIAPSDQLTIIPSFLYQRVASADEPYSMPNIPPPGPSPSYLSTAYLTAFQKQTYQPEPSVDRIGLSTVTIEAHLGGVDLTSISGYFDRSMYELTDATGYVQGALQGSPLYQPFSNILTTSYSTQETKATTQELRLASHDPSAALKWTAGLFFSHDNYSYYQPVIAQGLTRNLVAEFGPGTTLQTLVPSALPNDDVFIGDLVNVNQQFAAFGEASYELAEKWQLTLGGRAFTLRQSLERSGAGFFAGGATTNDPPATRFNGFNPRGIVDYKVTTDNMLYASASEGFRPGIVNGEIPISRCTADLAALGRTSIPDGARPDSLWNYEIGSKNDFLEHRLRVNGSAFQMNWSDVQLAVDLPTCGFSFSDNVGDARIRGGELQIDAEVIHGLTVGADATFLDAVITSASADVAYHAGDKLPDTPRHWYTAYLDWSVNLPHSVRGFARADYQWRGDSVRNPSSLSALPNTEYTAWNVTNLNLGAEWSHWQVRLFVNNVFNQSPTIDFFETWGQWRTSTLRPRTVGVNLATSLN